MTQQGEKVPSPFPGMDPYLEEPNIWEDFHQNLASQIQRQLASAIAPCYIAALETKITYEEVLVTSQTHVARPDIGLWDRGSDSARGTTAVAPAPFTAEIAIDVPVKLLTVEIRNVAYGTLVTAIEILSPVNKRPQHDAFDLYQRKRRNLLRRDINLVEIDLLRDGQRTPNLVGRLPEAPYFCFVTRGSTTSMEYWPIRLQDPLPTLGIPLSDPDPDASLDLGLAVQTIYDDMQYQFRIDYSVPPPQPSLSETDAAWVAALLARRPTTDDRPARRP